MIKKFLLLFLAVVAIPISANQPFIVGHLMGQLGNQMFITAATVSLALDHGARPLLPGFSYPYDPIYKLPFNHKNIFFRVDASEPEESIDYTYREEEFSFIPIPFIPNMMIFGWFQSDKYFSHHKEEILDLFAPSPEIINYLENKYGDIIDHPNTVAIHYRSYEEEDPDHRVYMPQDREYYEKAMNKFPKDTQFIIFSNLISWCKENFSDLDKNIRYIEGEDHFHDLYLMSMCKHNIICNSSFSWWGAYLNCNPDKIVIAPSKWFSPHYVRDTKDLLPEDWIKQ